VIRLGEVLHYLHVRTTIDGLQKLGFVENEGVWNVKTIWRADHTTRQVRVEQHFGVDYSDWRAPGHVYIADTFIDGTRKKY